MSLNWSFSPITLTVPNACLFLVAITEYLSEMLVEERDFMGPGIEVSLWITAPRVCRCPFGLRKIIREEHTWPVLIWSLGELLHGSEAWSCAISPHWRMPENSPRIPTVAHPGGWGRGCGLLPLVRTQGRSFFQTLSTRNSRASPEQLACFVSVDTVSCVTVCVFQSHLKSCGNQTEYETKRSEVKAKAPYLTHCLAFGKSHFACLSSLSLHIRGNEFFLWMHSS